MTKLAIISVERPSASNCCFKSFTDLSVELYSEALLSKPDSEELELAAELPLREGTSSSRLSIPGMLLANWA